MKPQQILPVSQSMMMIGRPIAYYPEIAKIIGIKATVFLCQFIYWEGRQDDPEGWIYKTQEEIFNETGLSRKEQESARTKLKELGILEEKLAGIPATVHYKFNWDELDKLISTKRTDQYAQKVQTGLSKTGNHTIYTETTTETTNNIVDCDFEKFKNLWNEFAIKYSLSQINILTDKRIRKLKARLRNKSFDFNKILGLIPKSSFLLGQNKSGWKVNFDWLIENDDNFIRILEGGYGIKDNDSKKYSYQEVLEITGGKIQGKFEKRDDGFWYKVEHKT